MVGVFPEGSSTDGNSGDCGNSGMVMSSKEKRGAGGLRALGFSGAFGVVLFFFVGKR